MYFIQLVYVQISNPQCSLLYLEVFRNAVVFPLSFEVHVNGIFFAEDHSLHISYTFCQSASQPASLLKIWILSLSLFVNSNIESNVH